MAPSGGMFRENRETGRFKGENRPLGVKAADLKHVSPKEKDSCIRTSVHPQRTHADGALTREEEQAVKQVNLLVEDDKAGGRPTLYGRKLGSNTGRAQSARAPAASGIDRFPRLSRDRVLSVRAKSMLTASLPQLLQDAGLSATGRATTDGLYELVGRILQQREPDEDSYEKLSSCDTYSKSSTDDASGTELPTGCSTRTSMLEPVRHAEDGNAYMHRDHKRMNSGMKSTEDSSGNLCCWQQKQDLQVLLRGRLRRRGFCVEGRLTGLSHDSADDSSLFTEANPIEAPLGRATKQASDMLFSRSPTDSSLGCALPQGSISVDEAVAGWNDAQLRAYIASLKPAAKSYYEKSRKRRIAELRRCFAEDLRRRKEMLDARGVFSAENNIVRIQAYAFKAWRNLLRRERVEITRAALKDTLQNPALRYTKPEDFAEAYLATR